MPSVMDQHVVAAHRLGGHCQYAVDGGGLAPGALKTAENGPDGTIELDRIDVLVERKRLFDAVRERAGHMLVHVPLHALVKGFVLEFVAGDPCRIEEVGAQLQVEKLEWGIGRR